MLTLAVKSQWGKSPKGLCFSVLQISFKNKDSDKSTLTTLTYSGLKIKYSYYEISIKYHKKEHL